MSLGLGLTRLGASGQTTPRTHPSQLDRLSVSRTTLISTHHSLTKQPRVSLPARVLLYTLISRPFRPGSKLPHLSRLAIGPLSETPADARVVSSVPIHRRPRPDAGPDPGQPTLACARPSSWSRTPDALRSHAQHSAPLASSTADAQAGNNGGDALDKGINSVLGHFGKAQSAQTTEKVSFPPARPSVLSRPAIARDCDSS